MPDHTSNGMQGPEMICSDFDSLLSDALDGVLGGSQLATFQAHAQSCSVCGPLFAEVEAGRNWLKELTEVEPPVSLVHMILAATTGVDSQRLRVNVSAQLSHAGVSNPGASPIGASWWERAQAWASGAMEPVWGTIRQPRFAMSFGMAFFSLSVALSVLGVKPNDLRQVSLRPTAVRHAYYNTEARVVRYYDNIKLVYELQAAVRGIKRNLAPAEAAPSRQKDHKNDTTQQPEQKQDRNYSQLEDHFILASAPLGPSVLVRPLPRRSGNDLPVVSVTTNRRLV